MRLPGDKEATADVSFKHGAFTSANAAVLLSVLVLMAFVPEWNTLSFVAADRHSAGRRRLACGVRVARIHRTAPK